MSLPLHVAIEATGATTIDIERAPHDVRVVTDTRIVLAGDTFLALRGERFNGHDYVANAAERGAALAIIDDPSAHIPGMATLVVRDTLGAYMALAGAARDRFEGRVLAITGSTGKTTTKHFVAQMLAAHFGELVLASPANENNEIGVSKLLLAASNEEHDVLVIEMGARHPDDIAKLVAIAKPHLGILTNVGDAHIEIMGSRERLEEAKWALFDTGARAVLNAGDSASLARAPSLREAPHWFIATEVDGNIPFNGRITALVGTVQLLDISSGAHRSVDVDVRVPGKHNRENLVAAAAAALELGVALEELAAVIPDLTLPRGRYERIELVTGVTLIYDAYNANAAGMFAALDAFAQERAQRRIALLASMAELGEQAAELHVRVGAHAAAIKVDVLLVGGEFAGELALGASRAGLSSERIVPFVTNAQAAEWLRDHARSGDAVLLKGSRKYRLEEIVEELVSSCAR
ncbi:MAG TPA: UDP-N-acetylmuramoyl-tripeptide--D-alanyl-D-alanine ligase [Candidatus Baltobacteraceae bacterium]|nr:UDP-N-acetylmuramoyl-tripeptide--D-alanyl-D-alanine ligase [Candidatus Baltobacteraceae bacterium]